MLERLLRRLANSTMATTAAARNTAPFWLGVSPIPGMRAVSMAPTQVRNPVVNSASTKSVASVTR